MSKLTRILAALLLGGGGALLTSCNTVMRYQRGMLADYVMLPEKDALAAGMNEHIRFSREGSYGGGAVGGGGCGCN